MWRLQGQLDLGSGWLILESQVEAKLNVSESCCFYMWGSMFYLLVIFMQPFASIRNVDILWIATERWISSTQLWAEKNFFWQSLFSFILFSYLPVYTKGNPFLFILLPYFKDPFHLLFTNLDSTGRWLFPPCIPWEAYTPWMVSGKQPKTQFANLCTWKLLESILCLEPGKHTWFCC